MGKAVVGSTETGQLLHHAGSDGAAPWDGMNVGLASPYLHIVLSLSRRVYIHLVPSISRLQLDSRYITDDVSPASLAIITLSFLVLLDRFPLARSAG